MSNQAQLCQALVTELVNHGITDWVLAPGSRSTPIVLALNANNQTTITPHFDERGAGFFALGLSKSLQKPVVLLTTSGTATANLLPAIIEANLSQTPLIVITADRPFALQNNGANQSITQENMYQSYCQHFLDIPENAPLNSMLARLGYALYKQTLLKSPIHFNVHFSEPFDHEITPENQSYRYANHTSSLPKSLPKFTYPTLLITTPIHSPDITKWLKKTHCPILTDITANLSHPNSLSTPSPALEKTDFLLHIGDRRIDNQWDPLLQKTASKRQYWTLHDTTQHHNALNLPGQFIHAPLAQLCTLDPQQFSWPSRDFSTLNQESNTKKQKFKTWKTTQTHLSEPLIADLIAEHTPEQCALLIGNSLPIRAMTQWGQRPQAYHKVITHRGASGIDGLIASFAGLAKSTPSTPSLALIGDLSALHDLNSLSLLSPLTSPTILIIINNQGGQIFNTLPISSHPCANALFVTKQPWSFECAAEQFKIRYTRVETVNQFIKTLKENLNLSRPTLIEAISLNSAEMIKTLKDL